MTWSREELASIVAEDIEDGWLVNLGIGLPTSVIDYLWERDVLVHAENGVVGIGPPPPPGEEDIDLVDPGKGYATLVTGGAFIDSVMSFTLIGSGRLDLGVMGAYQVSFTGDLANFRLPGSRVAGIGGAADLAVGARRRWVMMTYLSKEGEHKLVPSCTYPHTARGVTDRVYTDHGIFECGPRGARLLRLAPGCDRAQLEADLAAVATTSSAGDS